MELWEKNRTLILYFALTFVSIFFIIFSQAEFSLNIKKIYSVTIYPIQNGTKNISKAIEDISTSITELTRLRKELLRTQKKLLKYESTIVEHNEIKRENERLKSIIEQQAQIEYLTILATIVAKDPQDFYTTIVLNRGYNHGVKKGMPVIAYRNAQKGLVGKIIEISANYSKVLPIIDQKCKVGVMTAKNRHAGILVGRQNPKSALCLIEYIDRNANIDEGEEILTSGMGGVFPKGLLVGNIFKIEKKNYGLYQDVFVKPVIDFSVLEDVYIIKKESDDELLKMLEEDEF